MREFDDGAKGIIYGLFFSILAWFALWLVFVG